MRRIFSCGLLLAACLQAATVAADSARGEQLFQTLGCVRCHSLNGTGGAHIGPDLGRRLDRGFTPSSLAATMWNHAPTMQGAMKERNIAAGDLNEQAAADLFAYFYSARFFDKPGDASRGKNLFDAKHCSECHGLTEVKLPKATPVTQWESITQPVALAAAMWNHGASMRDQFATRNLKWPELSAQDLTDLIVYIRNLPATRSGSARVQISAREEGEALFQSKGCVECHTGKLALAGRLKGKTLVDIAAAMWNHQPRMAATPAQLTGDEMREITSSLWATQFFQDAGDAAAGRRVYVAKKCAACHEDSTSGAHRLPQSTFSASTMVSALWHHGPQMLDQMQAKRIAWPRFEGAQMSNLIAYLNSQGAKN